MSRNSISWTIVAMAAVFMATLSLSTFTPPASGDEVLPGGRAAKIRSYQQYITAANEFKTIISAVEGDHGTIVTDVVISRQDANGFTGRIIFQYDDGSGWKNFFQWSQNNTAAPAVLSLSSGIPIPKGAAVRVTADAQTSVVLSGYVW